jgi:hypothetical protein
MGLIYIFIVNITKNEYNTEFKTLGNVIIKKLKFYGLQVILGNVAYSYISISISIYLCIYLYLSPARGCEVIGQLWDFSLGHQKSFCPHIPAALQTDSIFY